jgi:PncC family amidohydrolase
MSLISSARRLAKSLAASGQKIVLAESCTGGLVSASLTRVPGISAHHCGGVVTYRNETKAAWLGISPRILKKPGPVSAKVAYLMAQRVFDETPEATLAVSITGHLGPNAPPELDGIVFLCAIACDEARRASPYETMLETELQLPQADRLTRQKLAAEAALLLAVEAIGQAASTSNDFRL